MSENAKESEINANNQITEILEFSNGYGIFTKLPMLQIIKYTKQNSL